MADKRTSQHGRGDLEYFTTMVMYMVGGKNSAYAVDIMETGRRQQRGITFIGQIDRNAGS